MEVRFILKDNVTESQQQMIDSLNNLCFGIEEAILLNQDEGHLFGAVEIGACVAFEEEKVVGIAYVYKRLTDYDGEDFYIGGIGGLAIAPEYRGKGYARKLVEVGLQKSYEIGVDVACLFTERTETVHKLYEKFGYAYLNRDVYYIDSLGKERTRDDVMILGLRNKRLAEKILSTNGTCELKVCSTKKPWNPTAPPALPAVPELSALCVIRAPALKGGKNVSENNA